MNALRSCGLLFLLLIATAAAHAAPPVIPAAVTYQGVLLDDLGDPRTGSVDLVIRVFDALTGGTLIYTQAYSNEPLDAGIFSVIIGPVGDPTDLPDDPLSVDFVEAVSGDLPATGPGRFVEIQVGTDPPLPRAQILTVPYAVRAETAGTADNATSATTVTNLAPGLPPEVLTQIFEHVNFDGGPPSTDPSEGFADTDGDGVQNFVDPDNDDDGISDTAEGIAGTDINVVTATIDSISPSTSPSDLPTILQVTGTNFEPGMAVQVGGVSSTLQNQTPTSVELVLGPQPAGAVDVVVTRTSGEASAPAPYTFFLLLPTISNVDPPGSPAGTGLELQVTGTDFLPGFTVTLGGVPLVTSNETSTSFDATVPPGQFVGMPELVVLLPNGGSASVVLDFSAPLTHPIVVAQNATMALAVSGARIAIAGPTEYAIDTDADGSLDAVPFESASPGTGTPSSAAVAFDPSGVLTGVRCRNPGDSTCAVELYRDTDGDGILDPSELATTIETLTPGSPRFWAPTLRYDPAGRAVLGYSTRSPGLSAKLARDLDGDGDFDGAGEMLEFPNLNVGSDGDMALDSLGRAALVRSERDGSQHVLRVRWDRNGDGDFDDDVGGIAETQSIPLPGAANSCIGAAFDGNDRLAVIWDGGISGSDLAWDRNGDGDFDDASEITFHAGTGGCDLELSSTGHLVRATTRSSGGVDLATDANDDGVFDSGETVAAPTAASVETVVLGRDALGQLWAATNGGDLIFVD